MNALVLKNDKKLLSEVLLHTVKIRGVVCSENKPAPGVDENAIEASCITTLDKLKSNSKPGENIRVKCPKGCSGAKSAIAMANDKNEFSGDSSICLAGIYMGIVKDEESSDF